MKKGLWDNVLEGTFDSHLDNGGSYEAEVENYVTAEPETMVAYVASCTEGMLAVQTAVAMMEGECAVQYIRGEREKATATMEGVLRNAWETLKDWVRRAYAAIKKFLKKAWNKMKGYVNVFKAMVTKYAYVLKSNVPNDLKVDWVYVNMQGGAKAYADAIKELEHEFDDSKPDAAAGDKSVNNQAFHAKLEEGFFGGNKKGGPSATGSGATEYGRFVQEVDWKDVAKDAIRIADDGFDKAYSEAFKIGELTERDIVKEINREAGDLRDENDDTNKNDDTQHSTRSRAINSYVRRKTNLTRTYVSMVNTAASLQVRVAVKACRKAIRAQAQNSSATYGIESTDFSAVMGEIL